MLAQSLYLAFVSAFGAIIIVGHLLPLIHSVAEFIAHARANEGKITFASGGHGTSPHLSGELFKRMTGIDMMHG